MEARFHAFLLDVVIDIRRAGHKVWTMLLDGIHLEKCILLVEGPDLLGALIPIHYWHVDVTQDKGILLLQYHLVSNKTVLCCVDVLDADQLYYFLHHFHDEGFVIHNQDLQIIHVQLHILTLLFDVIAHHVTSFIYHILVSHKSLLLLLNLLLMLFI
jgi:hypothetical protein